MICINSISISPHVLAFFEPLAQFCAGRAEYQYNIETHDKERVKYGWDNSTQVAVRNANTELARQVRLKAEVLIDSMRDLDVLEKRARDGRLSFYASERWFKPPLGILRLLHPKYFRMAWRMSRLLRGKNVFYLAQGPFAAEDMARICGLMRGKLKYAFIRPRIEYEKSPCAKIKSADCGNMYLWGYFVAPSSAPPRLKFAKKKDTLGKKDCLQVLWVGRMLSWKRLKDLIEAVKLISFERKVVLDIYGEGPEEQDVRKRAKGCPNIHIHGFVKSDQVRELMRSHDVYVLTSNGYEGWGAVLSEALEEGMCVYGTRQSGAAAAILPEECLYDNGDVDGLCALLSRSVKRMGIGKWSGAAAAASFMRLCNDLGR